MPIQTRLGILTTLQSAVNTATNGTALECADATEVLCEISGTFTGITANWEGSLDGGATYAAIGAVAPGGTQASTATAAGLYAIRDAAGLTHVRARTTVATPTGSMTVRARAATLA